MAYEKKTSNQRLFTNIFVVVKKLWNNIAAIS